MNSVTLESQTYVIQFDYDPAIVKGVMRLPGRQAQFERGVWTVPFAFGSHVRDFAELHGLTMVEVAVDADEDASVDVVANSFEVRFHYADQTLLEAMTAIPGSLWFEPSSCWKVPVDQGLLVNEWAEIASAVVTDRAETAIAQCATTEDRIAASAAKDSAFVLKDGFGLELYDYQRAGVDYVIKHAQGRCIIGDEPGVGKTAQAMAVIHELEATPAVIVVPASLKINWRRELLRAMPGRSVEILRGTRVVPRLLWADFTILNYDILPAWIDHLPVPQGAVLDESHRIKNPKIARTKAAIELLNRVPQGGAALCLTGTAVLNKPNEILSQVQAIGQIDKFGGITRARKTYKRNGVALNRKLRATCYIRRKKIDVWVDAPDRKFADMLVEGDPTVMVEYRKAEADIIKYLSDLARKAAADSGAGTMEAEDAAWRVAMSASAAQHLVAINHLKQLSAKAKMPAAIEWCKNFLASGEKLGIFGWHTAVVNEMAATLNAPRVQGGQSEAQRQQAVDLFQNKPEVKVIVGQILAAGEGITLTAASNALLIEQPWTPGAEDQCLDRFHRRGQVNDVVGWRMLTEDTIDQTIQQLIAEKRKVVEEVLDGYSDEEETGGTVLQDLVVNLAERGMNEGQAA